MSAWMDASIFGQVDETGSSRHVADGPRGRFEIWNVCLPGSCVCNDVSRIRLEAQSHPDRPFSTILSQYPSIRTVVDMEDGTLGNTAV